MIIIYFINVKNLMQAVQLRCKNIYFLINYFCVRCVFAALYIVASFSLTIRTLDDVHYRLHTFTPYVLFAMVTKTRPR
jgi:hypothetical protein